MKQIKKFLLKKINYQMYEFIIDKAILIAFMFMYAFK